ncbi:family 2 glycosyl transferase, partial [Nocardiopsis sp. MG754419]|uniref:family 2 glycosyl transferase n=1 Tax=Nocardiopsis sp. MG754419 TaxID=2259865 RepID=UPI001BABB672
MAVPNPEPLPPGLGIDIDRAVRLADEGHLLVGGSPPRALRLPPEGVSAVIRWLGGARPRHHHERVLARTLVDTGLAHPRPEPVTPGSEAQVVLTTTGGDIDVRALARTLSALRAEHPDVRVLVVGATGLAAGTARRYDAHVVDGPAHGAAARAAGLRAVETEFVAFLHIGTEPMPGWLSVALGHFADTDVAAVVPRTLAARERRGNVGMTVAALRAAHCDHGPDPAPMSSRGHVPHGPGRSASHVATHPVAALEPVRALVVRRDVAGLDPSLGASAEVDLVWRLADAGRSIRYEPRSRVRVPLSGAPGAYLRARWATGVAAARLARRHGRRATGPRIAVPALIGAALAAAGRPVAGVAAGVTGVVDTARTLHAGAGVAPVATVLPAVTDLVDT